MRVRARLTTATAGLAAALAMVTSLSGCMTVHGETAVVPAASEEEAQSALDRYIETSNEAMGGLDPELNDTVETGPLGAIRHAQLAAQRSVTPGGPEAFTPLELSDPQFHIPQQAGWPKFFVADVQPSQTPDNRWLLVFMRNSIDEEWNVSYLSVLPPEGGPELAEDEDGYLDDLPVVDPADQGPDDPGSGLVMEPGALGTSFVDYLQGGEAPFAGGPYTSDELAKREEANSNPAFVTEYQDQAAESEEYAPVAMRTADGGALMMFTSLHHEKQTMAEGETPVVDPLVAALMQGEAERAVTLEWVAMHSAVIPEVDGGQIELFHRTRGVISATGE
ncbi:hypothetical protein [Streptomyces johnsoniae]|uniref:DUF8094 domain-containing protein n=1 Tax=Streptomyces johnsoniae TaxID=3075532 RepID=A0ABU2S810_9ACTN|nr:hypothetical protein [Streptomyces sp. DSM 41886]MDT0444230.1 hypothetical protein [Streptomyces sp. DSM 41886]